MTGRAIVMPNLPPAGATAKDAIAERASAISPG